MKFRYLRTTVTVLSVTACALLVALWVRSYTWSDDLILNLPGSLVFIIHSWVGESAWYWNRSPRVFGYWTVESLPIEPMLQEMNEPPPRWLDGVGGFSTLSRGVIIPYWALIAVFVFVAATPWMKWSKRFSLRTLLIATTLVALVLGIIVAAM